VIHQPAGDEVCHFALALYPAVDAQQARPGQLAVLAAGEIGMHDDVGEPGLVLDRDEDDAARGAGPLPAGDQPGGAGELAVGVAVDPGGGFEAQRGEPLAQQGERVAAQRQAEAAVIGTRSSPSEGGGSRSGASGAGVPPRSPEEGFAPAASQQA